MSHESITERQFDGDMPGYYACERCERAALTEEQLHKRPCEKAEANR